MVCRGILLCHQRKNLVQTPEPLAKYGSAAEFDAIRDIARGDAGATKSRAPL